MALTLTETEIACGVSPSDVTTEAERALVLENGTRVAVDTRRGPAVSGAAARERLGAPVEFAGLNMFGHAVYQKAAR